MKDQNEVAELSYGFHASVWDFLVLEKLKNAPIAIIGESPSTEEAQSTDRNP
jgi:hypothetical protein